MRLMIRLLPLVALLTFSAVTTLAADTYYCDPAAGRPDNDGSKEKPWKTLAEVISSGKLAKVRPGSTILLKSGYHGEVSFSGNNADWITIEADKDAEPRVSRLEISSGSKWRVRGLTISPSFGDKPYRGNMVVFGEGGASSDLIIEDCFIYTALDSSGWDVKQWMAANSGVNMGRHGKGLILRNCYILNTRFGVSMCGEEGICEGNVITNFSADGIRMTRDGCIARHNVIKNNFVGARDGDDNHDDGIQAFLFNRGTGTIRNFKVIGNIIINREDDRQKWHNSLQGIGFFDGPLVNFEVTDNVVLVDMHHGVSLYDGQNCLIERNVSWSRWGTSRKPWIQLGSKLKQGKDCTVRNNYAMSFKISQEGTKAENNLPSNQQIYVAAQERAYKAICEKFGRFHPVAGFDRLGMGKGKNPEKPAEKPVEKPAEKPAEVKATPVKM